MQQMGSKKMKTTGVIMIILGAFAIIAEISAGVYLSGFGGLGGILFFAVLISVAAAVLMLIAGILGVRNWNKPHKAHISIVLGIILIIFRALTLISNFASADWGSSYGFGTVVGSVLGILIPIFYVAGASELKKMGNMPYGQPPMVNPMGQQIPPYGQPMNPQGQPMAQQQQPVQQWTQPMAGQPPQGQPVAPQQPQAPAQPQVNPADTAEPNTEPKE